MSIWLFIKTYGLFSYRCLEIYVCLNTHERLHPILLSQWLQGCLKLTSRVHLRGGLRLDAIQKGGLQAGGPVRRPRGGGTKASRLKDVVEHWLEGTLADMLKVG